MCCIPLPCKNTSKDCFFWLAGEEAYKKKQNLVAVSYRISEEDYVSLCRLRDFVLILGIRTSQPKMTPKEPYGTLASKPNSIKTVCLVYPLLVFILFPDRKSSFFCFLSHVLSSESSLPFSFWAFQANPHPHNRKGCNWKLKLTERHIQISWEWSPNVNLKKRRYFKLACSSTEHERYL